MKYYFEENFKFDLPLFKKFMKNPLQIMSVYLNVEYYIRANHGVIQDFNPVANRTIWLIDQGNTCGVFTYYWLNAFARDVSYAVWRHVYDNERLTSTEKDATKKADQAMKEFDNWMKEQYP